MRYQESKKIFLSFADIPHILYNGYLRFQTQIPNFLPIDILLAALRKFKYLVQGPRRLRIKRKNRQNLDENQEFIFETKGH